MSGHSKWATTKHKKAIIDSRRAKVFAKQIRAIEVAARNGGADMEGNPTLFDAVTKAKKSSMPADNIDRAIKRGAGLEAGAKDWITIMYEGYGPNGVAIMIECLSDNRNRSASEIKVAVTRNGGSMADLGSVSYLFNRKGVIIVNKVDGLNEDRVLEAVLDAGAEEVNDLGESFEVVCEPVDLVQVRTALQNAGIDYESADSSFLPSMSIPLDAANGLRARCIVVCIIRQREAGAVPFVVVRRARHRCNLAHVSSDPRRARGQLHVASSPGGQMRRHARHLVAATRYGQRQHTTQTGTLERAGNLWPDGRSLQRDALGTPHRLEVCQPARQVVGSDDLCVQQQPSATAHAPDLDGGRV